MSRITDAALALETGVIAQAAPAVTDAVPWHGTVAAFLAEYPEPASDDSEPAISRHAPVRANREMAASRSDKMPTS